jgi:hypothetical protein
MQSQVISMTCLSECCSGAARDGLWRSTATLLSVSIRVRFLVVVIALVALSAIHVEVPVYSGGPGIITSA